ncbi:MAG: PIG-L family deacetylase [Meiothermus sp.]|nr:PIG-L family deacetylase [Meiothermus sp.]
MRILAIFAHPDDESFFCAGTLTRYASLGYEVYLICATRGEQGEIRHPEIDPALYPKGPARGRLRQAELEAACTILGLRPPIFLDYQDSGYPLEVARANPQGFMQVDLREVELVLLGHIARIQPEVIIGFDPQGYYGHMDHIHLHRATIGAFWLAGNVIQSPPKRLFFPVRSRELVMRTKFDPQIFSVSEDSFAVHFDVRPYAPTIRAALLAHRSQVGPESSFASLERDWPGVLEEEKFVLGGLRGSFPAMPVHDLLAGLEG